MRTMEKKLFTFATVMVIAFILLTAFLFFRPSPLRELAETMDQWKTIVAENDARLEVEIEALQKRIDELEHTAAASEGWHLLGNDFRVTFYGEAEGAGDPYYTGVTYTGTLPMQWKTAAVDPSVIPLGSTIRVLCPNGVEYVCSADDTGGAVRGNTVDIYYGADLADCYAAGGLFTGASVWINMGGGVL